MGRGVLRARVMPSAGKQTLARGALLMCALNDALVGVRVVVTEVGKGRLLRPAERRRRVRTGRFKVNTRGESDELQGAADFRSLGRKHGDIVKEL